MNARSLPAMLCLVAGAWLCGLGLVHAQSESWTSIGPPGGTVYALAVDPNTPSTIYAGTKGGVFKSSDGGVHWDAINVGLPTPTSSDQNGGPYIYSLAIDPRNSATLYAGVSFLGDIIFAEPGGVGVYKSDDGGDNWHAANVGIENRVVYAIAIDPQTPTTLYGAGRIGAQGRADVFKSTDGGASWVLSLAPTFGTFVAALEIDPQSPATVYAATSEGVFKSTDRGATWTAANGGLTSL